MTTHHRVHAIQTSLASLREGLLGHRIYERIDGLNALHVFMEHHVFAVWDFMSLLKALQRRLTCVDVPWIPPDHLLAARFINEVVLGEESDEDGHGGFASHFDLYYRAMRGCGANTRAIDGFLGALRAGRSVSAAVSNADVPSAVAPFVTQTMEVIESGDLCAIASSFTFGREDLLPAVFQRIVDALNVETTGGLDDFIFYLNRHIQLDGDSHGPMAAKLLESVCGDDDANWQTAERAAIGALEARTALWDGMLLAMQAPA